MKRTPLSNQLYFKKKIVSNVRRRNFMWDNWGWHRVTFYGDLKEQVLSLADATGWKVVEEA